jgi:hypothetical protein
MFPLAASMLFNAMSGDGGTQHGDSTVTVLALFTQLRMVLATSDALTDNLSTPLAHSRWIFTYL